MQTRKYENDLFGSPSQSPAPFLQWSLNKLTSDLRCLHVLHTVYVSWVASIQANNMGNGHIVPFVCTLHISMSHVHFKTEFVRIFVCLLFRKLTKQAVERYYSKNVACWVHHSATVMNVYGYDHWTNEIIPSEMNAQLSTDWKCLWFQHSLCILSSSFQYEAW